MKRDEQLDGLIRENRELAIKLEVYRQGEASHKERVRALGLQLGEATCKGEQLCEAYGTLLLACRKLDSVWKRACTYDTPEILELRKLLEPVEKRSEASPISEANAHNYGTCEDATCLYCKDSR
jgi:hypothetical protein